MGEIERRTQIEALRALVAAIPANATLSGDVEESQTPPVVPASEATASSEPIADLDQAREIALNRLTYRSRSAAELLNDLVQRSVSEEIATQVVERFIRVGLLDDAEFAAEWVRSRQGPKSLSSSRLRAELRAKGIADDIIETALGSSASSDEDVAMKLAVRKAQGMVGVDRPVAERRLAGYLARKGYEPSVVWKAVRAALSGEAETDLDGNMVRR